MLADLPNEQSAPDSQGAQAPFQSKGEQFDAVKGYQEAQKKIAQQGQELAAFRDILGKVGVYFEMDKDKNEIRLNRDLIRPKAGTVSRETMPRIRPHRTATIRTKTSLLPLIPSRRLI